MNLTKRSITASCLLHLLAVTGLAAWSALPVNSRAKFAGNERVIELVITRAEPTWSEKSVTLDETLSKDVPVTVHPTSVLIARKHFSQSGAAAHWADALNSGLASDPNITHEIELHGTNRAAAETPPQSRSTQHAVLPRQQPQHHDMQVATFQLPQQAGNERTAPSFTTSPPPTYPSVAIQNRWEGTTLLRVVIDATGAVTKVEVKRSSGHPVLDGAAINAVQRWRGSPATRFGLPVATTELLPVRFNLSE